MIRSRARVLALCVLGALPLSSPAATINVTTPFDIVADNDELCSIREAVTSSVMAADLSRRKSADTNIESALTLLEKALLDIAVDPINVTYPRSDMVQQIAALVAEADAYNIAQWDATIVADLAVFEPKMQAIGSPRGTFDFSQGGTIGNAYPTVDEGRAPGYYTYADNQAPFAASVTITDPLNLPTNALVYNVGDRAYWDGSNWRRYGPLDEIPTGVDSAGVTAAIALHERMATATTSEVERLENLIEIDGCDDGTSFDVIFLGDLTECPGEPEDGEICHYKLNRPLDMTVRLSLRGAGSSTVLERCTAASCGGVASTGLHRLINVPESISTEIMSVTLRGGDAGTGFGGAIHAAGQLKLTDSRFEGNRAAAGGAIHVEENASAEAENVHFTGNVATAGNGGAINLLGPALKLTNAVMGGYVENAAGAYVLAGNTASGHGGAVAVMSGVTGNVSVSGGAYIGNQARRGSVIYVDSPVASVVVENATIAENHANVAGAINFNLPLAGVGSLAINNVTLIENTADNGSAGITVNRLMPLQILNSVIAGNTDNSGGARPDCDFVAGVVDPGSFRRNYYSNPTGAASDACPGARYPSGVPEVENFELGAFQLIGDLLNPLDPAVGPYYVPVFPDDVNNSTENRLVNRGAGAQEIFRCTNSDQRGHERSSSVDEECDIGAVEYQIGRRHDEVVEMLVDERRCINVIDDDLGDALYVPGSLRVYDVERAGFSAIVISRNPGSPDNNPGVDPLLDLDTECPNEADIPHREAILIVPARGFRGQTDVLYGASWQTGGSNPVTGTVTAIAHIETESRGGITTSTLGALSPLATLFFAGLLALRRLRARWLAAGLLSVLSATAVAAEDNVIYVNSGLDEPVVTTPGDGRCTLREALDTARNDRANMSGGDCVDGNEGPDTIEFAVGLTEVVLEDTLIAYGNVTLRCPEPPEPAAGQPAPAAQVCTIRRRAFESDGVTPNPRQFRLIDSRGSLLVHRLVFENGLAPDRGAGQDGGAIYSLGTLLIADSIFRNNSAVSGGAVFLAGPSSGLNILRSVFEGNSSRAGTEIVSGAVVGITTARRNACPALARGGVDGLVGSRLAGGGAIATTQSDGHQIAIQSSSFLRNCSVAGAAATDLNTRSSVVIANTTFSGNVSFEGPGAIDISGAQGSATLRNITVMENQSGISVVRETWDPPVGVLQRRALQFGVVGVTMTSSIISGNVTEIDNSVAANCAPVGASLGSLYNVFGDEDDDPAGVPTVGGYTCRVQANSNDRLMYADELFDPASPTTGLLSPLVGVEVGLSTIYMYVTRDAAAAAGIIVDAGFNDGGAAAEDNQVDPTFSSTGKCANVDARGASRESGGRCDIGTFEVLGVTAKEDLESNRGRGDRLVSLDLVANDLFDDISALPGKALKDDCDTTQLLADTPVAGARTYRLVGPDTAVDADANPDVCVEVIVPASEYAPPATPEDFPKGAGEVVFCHADTLVTAEPRCEDLIPESGFVLVYDNNDVLRDENRAGMITLQYRVFTVDQDASNLADIEMSVENVGPQAIRDEVIVGPGQTASINVLANDTDPDASSPAGLKLTLVNGAGCTAVYNDEDDLETVLYWQCQFGRVTMDAAGTITWTPINSFNPFSEEISYEVSDQDPIAPKVAKSIVRFTVGRPVSNGGSLLGKDDASDILGLDFLGAPSPLFFAVFLLALGRRRTS